MTLVPGQKILIINGLTTSFLPSQITPIVKESGLLSAPVDVRNCLFSHETHLIDDKELVWIERPGFLWGEERIPFFSTYSQEGCLFECLLTKASTLQTCQPWFFPTVSGMPPVILFPPFVGAVQHWFTFPQSVSIMVGNSWDNTQQFLPTF